MNLIINEENHFFGIYDNDKYYVNKTTSKKPGSSKSSSKGTSKSTSKPSSSSSSKSSSKSNSGSKSSSGSGGKSTSGSVSSSKSSSGSGGKSTSGVTPTSIKNADNRNTGYKAASSGYKPSTSSSSGYKSTSGVTPTSIKNTDNRNTGYKAASSGYKSTTSFSSSNKSTAIYKLSPGVTPTSIKNTDNRNTGYKAASSGYQYLRTARAEALGQNNYYIDGSIGNNFKRNLVYDELDLSKATNDKNIEAKDLKSFIDSVSKHTPVYYDKGEKLYVVDSEASGVLSVGPGIVLKYNNDYFKKYDLDVSNLREGATIPASIVDQVTNDILADKRKYVLNVLETNNIKGLSDSQIDALTSRAYSVGNISNFPNMYKQYGNTEELYNNYLSTVNGKDTIYEKELTARRNAEIDLFKNGYSSVEEEKENLRPGLTPTAINKIEKIKRSKKTPTAINSQDRLKDGYVNNDGISSNLRPGLTPSEINRQDKMEYNKTSDPLADYLDNLKAKGVDVSDITNGNIDILTKNRITNNNYTEEDINKFKNILWHEYGGSLTGNFSDDAFILLTIGATIVNNATAYGGKNPNKSWANSLEDAITNRKYLYENGRNYIYGTYNPSALGVPASTDGFLTEVAKLCLSGEYTIPSNLRGQSARYIMDSYDDKNNIHYLAGNEWYSDNNHDVVIYPLNEGKKNDKTVYTAEVSDVDIFGNKFKTTDSEAFKLYAESLAPKILENDLVRSKYPDYEV